MLLIFYNIKNINIINYFFSRYHDYQLHWEYLGQTLLLQLGVILHNFISTEGK